MAVKSYFQPKAFPMSRSWIPLAAVEINSPRPWLIAAGDRAVVDLVKAWKPPFNPSEVTRECAEALKPYRVTKITGDNYGGEWPVGEFRKHNILYELSELNRLAALSGHDPDIEFQAVRVAG